MSVKLITYYISPANLSGRLVLALCFWASLTLLLAQPLFAQEASATDASPTATITHSGLNVRATPALSASIIGFARKGEALEIVGQVENCRWLLVRTAKLGEGWISGKSTYVKLNVTCDKIDVVENSTAPAAVQPASQVINASAPITSSATSATAPVTATPQPTATAQTTPTLQSTATLQPTATAQPTATPQPTATSPTVQSAKPANADIAYPPAGQGCFLLQNRLGPPITVTFTNLDTNKSVQIIVPHGAEVPHCMAAGWYSYTFSSVGFEDKNGELKVTAGDAFMLPIESE